MDRLVRRSLGVTTALTFVLLLLGLYTGATGGGLSCGARWPLCNGAVFGLFPANWADFFEWFHRFVAMVVGFAMLGTLALAWRREAGSAIVRPLVLAVALLPAQVILGAITTTAGGAFPGGFNPYVITAHFSSATVIFAALVVATARAVGTPRIRTLRLLAAGTAASVAVAVVVRAGDLVAFTPNVQALYYGGGFAALAGGVALAVLDEGRTGTRVVGAAVALSAYLAMLASRGLWGLAPVVDDLATSALVATTSALLGVVFAAALAADEPTMDATTAGETDNPAEAEPVSKADSGPGD